MKNNYTFISSVYIDILEMDHTVKRPLSERRLLLSTALYIHSRLDEWIGQGHLNEFRHKRTPEERRAVLTALWTPED